MEQGWIKLHRKILNWEWYKNNNVVRVFLHLLLSVNHEDKKWQGIMIKSGQKITSYGHLAQELKLGVQSIRTALDKLKSTDEITIKTTNKYTMITILKWKNYQQPTNKLTNEQQTTNKQLTTNKNDKNVKNDKNTAEQAPQDIISLIESFIKINPSCKKLYGNTTQRKACQFLIDTYGFERVTTVIEKTLPKTNGLQFFPTITTPLQLQDKWSALEAAVKRFQSKLKAKQFII